MRLGAHGRANITGWICRARGFEESFPRDDEVEAAVTATARRLGEICRQLLPGTVRPLQRYGAQPKLPIPRGNTLMPPSVGRAVWWRGLLVSLEAPPELLVRIGH